MAKRDPIDVLRADTGNLSLFVRVMDVLLPEAKAQDEQLTTQQDDVGCSQPRIAASRAVRKTR
jgi:hypothetical protein